MNALAAPSSLVGTLSRNADWLSASLPRPADECYALFCAVERTPEWLGVIPSALVRRRDAKGRAKEVAFLARLTRATIGYTCQYRYQSSARRISWRTAPGARIRVHGFAEFRPLGDRACLMTYQLDVDLAGDALPGWSDPLFDGHAASAVLNDFRDFATRRLSQ